MFLSAILPADVLPLEDISAAPELGPGLWVWALVALIAVAVAVRVLRTVTKIVVALVAIGVFGGGSLAFLTGLLG